MRQFRPSQILAAALVFAGVAGLVMFAVELSGSAGSRAAAGDPQPVALGIVPPARTAGAASPAFDTPESPEARSQRDDGPYPIGGGSLTRGRLESPVAATPEPAGTTGKSGDGSRVPSQEGMTPIAIAIPKIGVAADIVPVGTTANGEMETPSRYDDVGWWSPGARPGERGRAVLAGHVDSLRGGAVFFNLDELEPGDEIIVGDGLSELRYTVRGSAIYRADAAPVDEIFGPSLEKELVLITCGGWFDRRTASYMHRRVVFAVLNEDQPSSTP